MYLERHTNNVKYGFWDKGSFVRDGALFRKRILDTVNKYLRHGQNYHSQNSCAHYEGR